MSSYYKKYLKYKQKYTDLKNQLAGDAHRQLLVQRDVPLSVFYHLTPEEKLIV